MHTAVKADGRQEPLLNATAHTRPTIPALTGLRAVLMMHVLVRNMRYANAPDQLGWMVDAGAVGVSAFFCLSGFILAYCYGDHRFQTWRCYFAFIGRRCARLLPVYWLSQLMCVGVEVNSVKAYGWDVWSVLHWLALATGTNMWWPWPAYELSMSPNSTGRTMLNPTLWALSVVLFFYVTMPVFMRAMRWCVGVERLSELPNSKSTFRLLLLWLLCAVLVWPPLLASASPNWQHMPYPRLVEFCFGLTTATLYLSIRRRQQQVQAQREEETEGSMEAAAPHEQTALIDRLASAPLLNSPLLLDIATAMTVLLVILLALPAMRRPDWLEYGSWLAAPLSYIILALALTSSSSRVSGIGGVFSWVLTRPIALDLGAMSFCFYAFHAVPYLYAESIGIEPNRSTAVMFCAAVGLAWLGYKYVETPVYGWLSARLPACRCHKE